MRWFKGWRIVALLIFVFAGLSACGVYDALGLPVRSLPLTPNRVLEAMKAGGGA